MECRDIEEELLVITDEDIHDDSSNDFHKRCMKSPISMKKGYSRGIMDGEKSDRKGDRVTGEIDASKTVSTSYITIKKVIIGMT